MIRKRTQRAARCALLFCCFSLGLEACARREPPTQDRCAALDAGTPIDPLLLSFLSRARAAHHLADDHESEARLAEAISPLARLVAGPLPRGPGAELGPEVREVLADTRARLADLKSRLGAFDDALAEVRAGLENAPEPNYFRGHLLETEGLVEERHARALEKSDPPAATLIRQRAIGLLEQAMVVQAGVLEGAPAGSISPSNPAASAIPAASAR